MRKQRAMAGLIGYLAPAMFAIVPSSSRAQAVPPLTLVQTIPLPGVEGRIDHLAADTGGRRLFIAALGNNTLEVVDLASGKRVRSVPGFEEPQGMRYIGDMGRLVVANGGDGSVRILDGRTFAEVKRIGTSGDADNVRYDAAHRRVVVGYGAGGLAFIDPSSGAVVDSVALAGHPESFQIDRDGARVYVNVPRASQVAVVDVPARTVTSTWPVNRFRSNYPMALDEAHHRLFVGTRLPARLVVFDTESGREVAALPISGDTDDLFYDEVTSRVYVIAGEGAIDVIGGAANGKYERIVSLRTAPGARTGLFVPEERRLYVAIPHRGAQGAAVQVYDVKR